MASKKTTDNIIQNNTPPYFEVSLDTFLYNAGIIGFIEVLKSCNAIKDKDYIISGQTLKVMKEFLSNPKTDLAEGYIDVVCKKFGDKTRIHSTIENIKQIIQTKKIDIEVEEKTDEETSDDKKTKSSSKKKKSKLDNIIESLTAASIKTGCNTMNSNGVKNSIQENIDKINKLKNDINSIIPLLFTIIKDFEKDEIRKTLLMKNIIYTKVRLFWDGVSFLNKQSASNSIKDEFIKSFEKPLKDNIKNPKEEKYSCITCGISTSNKISTSFLSEIGVDSNRKKSAFWNQVPDCFICPLCNFIYSCSPLGFIDMDISMVFVNQNDSIKNLQDMNATIDFIADDKSKKYNFYNTIIQRALSIKAGKELSSIQVIYRNEKHYSSNIIGEDTLAIIKVREKELETLSNIYVKDKSEIYIDVFDECLKNIFNNVNQWDLIFKLLKCDTKSYSFIFMILKIQITQKYKSREDSNVDSKINYSRYSSKAGNEMRQIIVKIEPELDVVLTEEKNKEADNKLRGLVYQLVNAVHTSNRDLFLSNITRLYTSMNIAIPTVFMNIFSSDEDFKEIGYAYIIGLKGGHYMGK